MATLTNTQINLTYPSLIKFDDNLGVQPTTAKQLTDGVGGSLPISVSQVQTVFQTGSIVDFTGTTVNGLAAGGLVAGSGPDSMESAAFLSPNPANASGSGAIALGNGARAEARNATAIGNFAECLTSDTIVIGNNCNSSSGPAIAIGRNASANGSVSTAFGNSAQANASQSIAFSAENCTVNGTRSIAIGRQAGIGSGSNNTAIGNFAKILGSAGSTLLFTSSTVQSSAVSSSNSFIATPGQYGGLTPAGADSCIVIGSATSNLERAQAADTIAIGRDTQASNVDSIAFGRNATTLANGAVAIGAGIQATRANTVSVNELEVKANNGGVVLYSPNGTGYKVTVTDGGLLQTTAI